MSILKKVGENLNGGVLYALLFLWFAIMLGIPALIWGDSTVNLCGIIAMCATLYLTILDQFNIPFVKKYPLTFVHLCYVVIYAIEMLVCMAIGKDSEIFASIDVSFTCLFVALIIDLMHVEKNPKENKREKQYKVGDKFSIKYYASGCPYVVHYTIVAIEEGKIAYRDQSYITHWDDIELFKKKVQDRNFNWVE